MKYRYFEKILFISVSPLSRNDPLRFRYSYVAIVRTTNLSKGLINNAFPAACPESRAEWMELGGGGGAVCYAPSRLGKLVLRVTGFPRVTQQCHVSQHPEENHHRETRHLYLGFHHPWDRDLWKGWIKEVSDLIAILSREIEGISRDDFSRNTS